VIFYPALVTEEHPLDLKEEISAEILGLNGDAARAEHPIRIELVVQKDEENFLATGWATTSLSLLCGRCAGWMPWPIRARVEHLFEGPHPNCIDLTPLIREDILLELPLNAACRLGADGRCPVTGEIYKPRPETSGTLAGEEVWEALSKVKTKD
jgi:uncharacterized metal-binding protein YceD (DUF177 family)